MKLLDVIAKRYSVRMYRKKPIEDDKLMRILDAARMAPSANNRQEWRFVVVRDQEKRNQLMEAAKNQHFVGEAPVVIACCAVTDNHVMSCGQLCYPIDVAIAIDHLTLQAVAEGLGTCWIGAFFEQPVRAILNIPDDVRVVELVTVGYPADRPLPKDRLDLGQIVMYEEWEE